MSDDGMLLLGLLAGQRCNVWCSLFRTKDKITNCKTMNVINWEFSLEASGNTEESQIAQRRHTGAFVRPELTKKLNEVYATWTCMH